MRIQKLELKNFRGFEELVLDFPEGEGGLAVFVGVNGSGKSSILDSIVYLILQHYQRILNDTSISHRYSSSLYNEKNIKYGKDEANLLLKIYLNNDKNNNSINTAIITKDESDEMDGESIGPSKSFPSPDSFPMLIYYNANRAISNNPSLKAKNLNKLKKLDSLQLDVTRRLDFDSFFEWFRNTEDFENEKRLVYDPNYRHIGLEAIRKAIFNFLPYIKRPRVSRQPIEELIIEKKEQILSISQFSQGEKMIFAMIGDIISRINIANPNLKNPLSSDGVVLIDEIEQHLHPSWQRTIIPNLRKTFPNIQFIITTHSPQVLSNVKREHVFILEDFKLRPFTPHTFGRDSNSILYDLFRVEKRPPTSAREISELYNYIDANDRGKAEKKLQEIKKNLGEGDVEVMRAESYIELMDE